MSVSISPVARKQYEDANGNPAVGYKLFFYAAGSTTKQNTYTTSAGSVANANPITLDSEGRTPYPVWFTDGLSYKEVLASPTDTDPPASGVLMGDNLLGSGAATVTQSEWTSQPVTPTYISATVFTVSGDQTVDFHANRRVKATVTAGTAYGFITSSVYSSLTTVTCQWDSTTLDSGLSAVSLGMLSATNPSIPNAPQVFTPVNLILNPRFNIAQAGTSFAAAATGAYDLDGWLMQKVSTAVQTIAQDSASVPTGSNYARKVTFTTADAAVAAGDFIGQETRIEGYDAHALLNNSFTLGFWVRSSVTGIHCVSFYNGTSSYIKEYTIDTANTWEYKSVTVISGTPVLASQTNAAGLNIRFGNMCGTTFQTTAGTWQTGDYRGTSSQVNDAATISNTFHLADVSLQLGTVVASKNYNHDEALSKCLRYYQYISSFQRRTYGAAAALSSDTYFFHPMRDIPTATLANVTNANSTGGSTSLVTTNSCVISFTITALGSASITGCTLELASRL